MSVRHVIFDGRVLQVFGIQIAHIEFGAILGLWASATVLAFKGWIERGIGTQLGNQVQTGLPDHERTRIVAKMSIHHHIFQG